MTDYPHRRRNLLTGDWVLVSPHRTLRPWQGRVEARPPDTRPPYDPDCYLCPGNRRANGAVNPDYDSTYVFTNDFAALLPDAPDPEPDPSSLLRAEGVRGTNRVLCFSPRHDLSLPDMTKTQIGQVIDLWAEQVSELSQQYRWVQIFENKGAMMGSSNPHPHGQIWASDRLPNEPAKEDREQRRYFETHGRRMLLDYVDLELGKRSEVNSRLVLESKHWVALVPYWALWPFEILLLPRRAVRRLPDLDAEQRTDLAAVLKTLLQK